MLNLAPENPCFQGTPCGELKRMLFASFSRKRSAFVLAPRSGLFLYRTNRTKEVNKTSSCPYGIGFNDHGKAVPLFCGKWSCDACRVTLAKQWAWRASLHINNTDHEAYFWTLTLRGSVHTAYQGFKAIPQAWDNLRKTMQRSTGKWTYLAFVECHPHRMSIPHFHALSLTAAPVVGKHKSHPIKDLAYLSGFGYMATEEIVQGWKAAWYVAKYASKHDPSIPRNFRRCRCSRDWAKLPPIDLPAYYVKSRTEHLSEYLARVGECTGVGIDTLYGRWRTAHNVYEVGNAYDDE